MNRDALDEFFARADDVLDDWQGSDDAMNTTDDGPLRLIWRTFVQCRVDLTLPNGVYPAPDDESTLSAALDAASQP